MSASDDERREEMRARLPSVIRIAAGIIANPQEDFTDLTEVGVAEYALAIVLACEEACGIGGDDDR